MLICGAADLEEVDQGTADRSIQESLDGRINHVDLAAGDRDVELCLGLWMPEVRDRIFLASKTGVSRCGAAWAQINASFKRQQIDDLDLLQRHGVDDLAKLDGATGTGGALEAAVRAGGGPGRGRRHHRPRPAGAGACDARGNIAPLPVRRCPAAQPDAARGRRVPGRRERLVEEFRRHDGG
jgi:hypothetical protein